MIPSICASHSSSQRLNIFLPFRVTMDGDDKRKTSVNSVKIPNTRRIGYNAGEHKKNGHVDDRKRQTETTTLTEQLPVVVQVQVEDKITKCVIEKNSI